MSSAIPSSVPVDAPVANDCRMNMLMDKVGRGRGISASSGALPHYAPLDSESAGLPRPGFSIDDTESEDGRSATPAVRRRRSGRPCERAAGAVVLPPNKARLLPSSRRFWADFTLGFADGLTVPFALTAGLSSLGHTDTVLSAGLAEISAGCISMGIGGYLSARQTRSADHERSLLVADGETTEMSETTETTETTEKTQKSASHTDEAVAGRYLEPLGLPSALRQLVLDHMAGQPHMADALAAAMHVPSDGGQDADAPRGNDNDNLVWPVSAGLSVAGGYLVGGMLPLWPYFFVASVGDGLRCSFAVCILALFAFGFVRDWCLSRPDETARPLSWQRPGIPWRRVWKSTCEGLQMVLLGGIAAIAAVLCVRLFEDAKSRQDGS